jgi:NAD(P)-dependent dehydrogenase (short-subunit alcohol dehydrogenase family)
MTTDLARLDGKIAVVTGGTQGVGEAIARAFVARGLAGLVICGRQEDKGEAVAAALTGLGCRTVFVRADLADVDAAMDVVRAADQYFGTLHILVNAAGITDRGNIFNTSPELFDRMFAVNVRAPFFLMQEAVKIMARDRVEGAIVNIQSMSAHGGQGFIAAYCASKGALAALTRNTANALLNYRIRVNGLNIGWMHTPGEDRIMKTYNNAPDNWLEEAVKTRPFGRLIDPAEVARAAAYLASAESGLMTGANIDFDQMVSGTSDPPLDTGTHLLHP